MAKIEMAIKDAILRGARRQARLAAGPLRREVRRLRLAVGQLRQHVAALREVAAQWRRAVQATPWKPEVPEEEAKVARLSPRLIGKLRARLGLSQAALAKVIGVSAGAVVQWERGRSTPGGPNRRALVALRKLGRRDVKRVLATMPASAGAGKTRKRAKRRRSQRRKRLAGRR